MTKIDEIRRRHEIEAAMDINGQYSEWSQPALAGRLRQSIRDRAHLLQVCLEAADRIKELEAESRQIEANCDYWADRGRELEAENRRLIRVFGRPQPEDYDE